MYIQETQPGKIHPFVKHISSSRESGPSAVEKLLFPGGMHSVEGLNFTQQIPFGHDLCNAPVCHFLELVCSVNSEKRSTDPNKASVNVTSVFGSVVNMD